MSNPLISVVHDTIVYDFETLPQGPHDNTVASEDAYPEWEKMKKVMETLMETAREAKAHVFINAHVDTKSTWDQPKLRTDPPWGMFDDKVMYASMQGLASDRMIDTILAMKADLLEPSVYEQLAAIEPAEDE